MSRLEFHDVHKSFRAVKALRGVGFSVEDGEAHAIVGENGAGKSTLLRILAGSVTPDQGEVRLDGQRLRMHAPRDALSRGIGVVHQELLAFPNLSVTANVFAGRELVRGGGRLQERAMRERTRELLARLHLDVSPDAPMESLSRGPSPARPGGARAHLRVPNTGPGRAHHLAHGRRDRPPVRDPGEPSPARTDPDLRVASAARGLPPVRPHHRPARRRLRGTMRREEVGTADVVRAMVGRDLPPREARAPSAAAATRLALSGLTRRPCFEGVSLTLRAGEIVGVFGLVGSGRSELLETLVGLHAAGEGAIELDGRAVRFSSPREAARAGLVLVPEDRQRQGLLFNLALSDNLALPRAEAAGDVIVRRERERRSGEALMAEWRIKASGLETTPDTLSGGNQQKVVLARWLATGPRVLLLDEPTKGVDVGAKYEIHGMVRRVAGEGAACLVVSSDLPEILGLADRILVMREGRLQGEIAAAQATEENVMHLATHEKGEAA
jgi:rhamnose transport system ATP-binding protein